MANPNTVDQCAEQIKKNRESKEALTFENMALDLKLTILKAIDSNRKWFKQHEIQYGEVRIVIKTRNDKHFYFAFKDFSSGEVMELYIIDGVLCRMTLNGLPCKEVNNPTFQCIREAVMKNPEEAYKSLCFD